MCYCLLLKRESLKLKLCSGLPEHAKGGPKKAKSESLSESLNMKLCSGLPEHAEGGLDGDGLRHLVDLEHVAQVDREVHPGRQINKIPITFQTIGPWKRKTPSERWRYHCAIHCFDCLHC